MTATTTQTQITTQAAGRQWLVDSFTTADVRYIVRNVRGNLSCDCPHYYHHAGRANVCCKHVAAVVNHLAAADARISALVAERNPLIRTA